MLAVETWYIEVLIKKNAWLSSFTYFCFILKQKSILNVLFIKKTAILLDYNIL